MQQVDGRKLWLDEGLAYAGKFLTQALEIEKGRKLSAAEERFKQVSAAYIYLHDKLRSAGVLDEEELDYIFEKETIH